MACTTPEARDSSSLRWGCGHSVSAGVHTLQAWRAPGSHISGQVHAATDSIGNPPLGSMWINPSHPGFMWIFAGRMTWLGCSLESCCRAHPFSSLRTR
jgi:hypothetical protein